MDQSHSVVTAAQYQNGHWWWSLRVVTTQGYPRQISLKPWLLVHPAEARSLRNLALEAGVGQREARDWVTLLVRDS